MCVFVWALQDKVIQLKGALSDAIAAAEELDELVAKKEQEISTLQERNRELEDEAQKHAKQEAELSTLYRNSSMEVQELQVKS
jgi:F0F1-type ATP synthase membrane subunit b/b'